MTEEKIMENIKRGTGMLIIDVTNSNPNGDPDRESDPRIRQDGCGEISPVSFKRKLRDIVAAKDGPVWQGLSEELGLESKAFDILESKDTDRKEVAAMSSDNILAKYWDARVFGTTFLEKKEGSVIATGVVQFGLGVSLNPIRVERMTTTKVLPVQEEKQRVWLHCLFV